MRRDEQSRAELRALVDGGIVARSGTNGANEDDTVPVETSGHEQERLSKRDLAAWARLDSNQGPTDYEASTTVGRNGHDR
jgi:hypothetical protein